jgi:hypothetical protein
LFKALLFVCFYFPNLTANRQARRVPIIRYARFAMPVGKQPLWHKKFPDLQNDRHCRVTLRFQAGKNSGLGDGGGGFLAFPHIRRTFLDMSRAFSHITKPFRDIKKWFPHVTKPIFE